MKVRIIKCNSELYWYKDELGSVFNVTDDGDKYRRSGDCRPDYIDKDDCEIVSDLDLDSDSCDCGGTGGKHHPICLESPIEKARTGRTFLTGAYRDGENGKLDYSRALCPNVMERYLEFLSANRKQSNGDMRDFDNWKKGIPVRSYLSSMMRHAWTVWMYFVGFKKPKTETGDIVDELCAIMFNVNGLIHVILKARERKRQRLEQEKPQPIFPSIVER